MANFIDIDYLKNLGFRFPDSSLENMNDLLNETIGKLEKQYFQKTIGYNLTSVLYALDPENLPAEIDLFLNGVEVDGSAFYEGILKEISFFIMASFYGQLDINVNNSGFTSPVSDGENNVSTSFVVNALINKARYLRVYSFTWLDNRKADDQSFFQGWDSSMFSCLKASAVW